jgi:hypothetical protein
MRIKILTQAGNKYLGLAKNKFAKLQSERLSLNLPVKKEFWDDPLTGVLIELYSADWDNYILITGGALFSPQILLSGSLGFYAYSYDLDKLSFITQTIQPGDLSPIYNGRSQVVENLALTFGNTWKEELLPGGDFTFLGGINNYEMGIFNGESEIYGRIREEIGNIATVPDTFLPDFAKPYGSLFGLSAYKEESAWNLFRGIILYTLNPANQSVQDSWYWTPSFFSAAPGDPFELKPGWYYGQYPFSNYGIEDALESAKVSFKGMLDTRYTGGDYSYGWAEVVREINGAAVNDLQFFFQSGQLQIPSNPSFGNVRVAGTTADQFITVGSESAGFDSTVTLSISDFATEPELEMWNFQIFTDQDSFTPQQDSGVCIALISPEDSRFYRFSGTLTIIHQTETYHSHSTSRDGATLAIFESDNGSVIDRVHVFDLFGPGFAELKDSLVVAGAEALTGNIIPFRAKGFSPAGIDYSLAAAQPILFAGSDYTDFLPSLSHLAFPKTGVGSATIKKITCLNGVDAEYGITVDDCFGSTIVIDDPDTVLAIDKLVGSWDEGGVIRGKVRGNFTGAHPSMRFAGIGSGPISTLPPTFSIIESVNGILSFEGFVGDLIIGDCIILDGSNYIPDPACDVPNCDDFFEMTASSSCGQTASKENPTTPPATLTLTGPDYAEVGDEYVVAGGLGPYEFAFSGGSISDSGDTGTIDSVDSCNTGTWINGSGTRSFGGPTFYLFVPHVGVRLDYSSTLPNVSSIWLAQTTTPRVLELRRVSDDQVVGFENYLETSGRFHRIEQVGVSPNGLGRIRYSTNYNCGGIITVEDSCGTIATLDVSAVP